MRVNMSAMGSVNISLLLLSCHIKSTIEYRPPGTRPTSLRFTSLLCGRRECDLHPPDCGSRSDKCRTSAARHADGRKAGSAARGGWKTSAAAGPLLVSIYLPYCLKLS